ncbi:MAG: glycosyltransferase family 61 protein [Pseudomonadota bacterium]
MEQLRQRAFARTVARVGGRLTRLSRRAAGRWRPVCPVEAVPGGQITTVRPPEPVGLARPNHIADADWQAMRLRTRDRFEACRVAILPEIVIRGTASWLFTKDGRAIDGLWAKQGGDPFRALMADFDPVSLDELANAIRLDGTTLILNQIFSENFFHFTSQVLPRLALMSEVVDVQAVDHVITPSPLRGFMRAWLLKLGFTDDQLIPMPDLPVICERAVVTNNPGDDNGLPAWAIDYLRQKMSPVPAAQSRRLFITRDDAPTRRLLNQNALQPLIEEHGFESVSMSGRSVAEQADLFASADVILGVHGAALVNLVFAKPGTRVVELIPKNHLNPCFLRLAQTAGLAHRLVMGLEAPHPLALMRQDIRADLTVDPLGLSEVLRVACQA